MYFMMVFSEAPEAGTQSQEWNTAALCCSREDIPASGFYDHALLAKDKFLEYYFLTSG